MVFGIPGVYIDWTYTRVVFRILKQLTDLAMKNLPWKPGIFRSLQCLSYLGLKNNELTTLPVAFLQGVGSAHYKGECEDDHEWWWKRELRLDIGNATSYLHPREGYLLLENMNLTELPAGVFDGLEYLHRLHLRGNKLRTLPEGLFRNLSSLNKLDLQGNKLRTLPEGLFQNLSSLSQLYLHGNSLRTLPEGLFRNLRSLWELHLQRNKLRTFRDGHFRNLSSLKQLDLQGNCLRTLPKGLFRDLSGLRYLYLQNNGLEELPSSACAKRCWFDFLVLFAVDDFPSFALNSLAFLGNDQN